jgi:hypothetical protein
MATSSILGGERAPTQAAGRDVGALGPSDTSDSGSDVQGQLSGVEAPGYGEDLFSDTAGPGNAAVRSDSDSGGTGERGAAVPGENPEDASDITPDRVVRLTDALDDPDQVSIDELDQELEGLADEPIDEDASADSGA